MIFGYNKKIIFPKVLKNSAGFTLMEILVATSIFAIVVAALMGMFNYTLKINRRSEALRQASQGMRDLIELVAKEIRNGQIDYATTNSGTANNTNQFYSNANNPCKPSGSLVGGVATYAAIDNKLAILNSENNYECFYLAEGPGNTDGAAVGGKLTGASAGSFGSTATNKNPVLALQKEVLPLEVLTPQNVSIQRIAFMIRPVCDPYSSSCVGYGGNYPKIQPFVTIIGQFRVNLPTGEQTDIYYQTSVSSNDYGVPN